MALLGLGLPLLFALSVPLVSQTENVLTRQPIWDESGSTGQCQAQVEVQTVFHSERSWWLLAPSPYVVLADAAPKPLDASDDDPLSLIRTGVREARLGPPEIQDWCGTVGDPNQAYLDRQAQRARDREALGITWPYGLALDVGLGALFTVVAVRRLRAPARRLPRGTRVA